MELQLKIIKEIFLQRKYVCRERNGYCAHNCIASVKAENINK
jgi:hypothetical protein